VPPGARPQALAYGFGAVWVANTNDGTVTRIDGKTQKVVAVIGVGAGVRDIATGFGAVWVANGTEGTVTKIDPALNAPEETLPLAGDARVPAPVNWVAVGRSAVWVTRGQELLQLDPRSGAVVRRVSILEPVGLAAQGDRVWVISQSGWLQTLHGPRLAGSYVRLPIAAPTPEGGALWLISYADDSAIGRVTGWKRLSEVHVPAYPLDLAFGAGRLWTVDVRGGLYRIDPGVPSAVKVAQLRPTIRSALAVGGGKVWIAVENAT